MSPSPLTDVLATSETCLISRKDLRLGHGHILDPGENNRTEMIDRFARYVHFGGLPSCRLQGTTSPASQMMNTPPTQLTGARASLLWH